MTCFDPHRHHRHSIRLKGYDYSRAGAYFVTVVAQGRQCLFGSLIDGEMHLNDAGIMVTLNWKALPKRFLTAQLDDWVLMPNHLHGIIMILDAGATLVVAPEEVAPDVPAPDVVVPKRAGTSPAPTLGKAIGAFESITTVHYIRGVREMRWPPFESRLWQRNYYEHIIRNERELNAIANTSSTTRRNGRLTGTTRPIGRTTCRPRRLPSISRRLACEGVV